MPAVVAHTLAGDPGAERTLVCHPGGPGLPGTYFGDLAGLAGDRLRVIQVHPRGTNGSPPPADDDYRIDRYADDLEGLREHLGLDRLDLLGHSHGGFVAITYAAARPHTTGDVILLCTAARFSAELAEEAAASQQRFAAEPWFDDAQAAAAQRRARGYADARELRELYVREARMWFTDPADSACLRDPGNDPQALEIFNADIAPTYDVRPLLPRITARTLVLNGSRDFFGPRISARELAAIPGAEVEVLDDATHFPFLDTPEAFRARLAAFLGL
jgi:pimeloyl-ACP methyl ester carboxylesterase